MRVPWNDGWEFTETFDDAFLRFAGDFPQVRLPHTCRETPYDYFDESIYQMVCGYRKRLSVPQDWAGRRVFLHVGAAGHVSEVYLNGEMRGAHGCGYTAFDVELTDGLRPGETAEIAVKVDSRESCDVPPFGKVIDYMTYGGLYREVWLEIRPQTFLRDVFVQPEITGALRCETTVSGDGADLCVRHTVLLDGQAQASGTFPVSAPAQFTVPDAKLWRLESPALYTLKTELLQGDAVLDETRTRFGFRSAEFRADGFYLNGEKVKLIGLNRHQSYPYVGYAMPKRMQYLDAEILKRELGVNAVRTSHYPQSQHFVDRCDELGLLVFTEIPGWQHIGASDAWRAQAVKNTEDMVVQYRNHPSVILWGVRINESQDDDALYRRTNEAAHRLDPTRQTGGVRCYKKGSLLEDVYTYNDFSHNGKTPGCEPKKAITPDMGKGYLISEYNGHMYPTKSFDPERVRLEHMLRHANVLDAVAGQAEIAGAFGWCMFDYNTHRDFGSGDRICYHGVTDMFRNRKFAADVYAVQQSETPVLSVSSAMDIGEHPAAQRGKVWLLTNADSVRMYKNDVLLHEYTHAESPYRAMRCPPIPLTDLIGDQVAKNEPFAPRQAQYVTELLNYAAVNGWEALPPKIMAKAAVLMTRYRMTFEDAYALFGKYISNWGSAATVYRFEAVQGGKVVKTLVCEPFASMRLSAELCSQTLCDGETYDVAAIRLRMCDRNGVTLPFYQGAVQIGTQGPIAVIGPQSAVLRGGMGGTYVKTTGSGGEATVTLSGDGFEPVTLRLSVKKEEYDAG